MSEEGLGDARDDATGSEYPWTPRGLTAIRSRREWRASALLVAVLLGLGLAWVHWLGLFVAGTLLGLPSRRLRDALLAGVVFGVLVLGVQILLLPGMDIGKVLALRPPVYVTLGAGIGAPAWGALIRGVV